MHGIQTKKPLHEVTSEIQRSFKTLNVSWDFQDEQVYTAKYQTGTTAVKFSIEILHVPSNGKEDGYFLNFVHQSGEAEDYDAVCELLQEELEL